MSKVQRDSHNHGSPSTDDPVPELIALLGSPVVFIAWPRGVKGTERKWKHLTEAHMTPEYLANLQDGNIGVALGEVSGGLCAIDWDKEEFVETFVSLNPYLKGTLQTHGARGRVFWVRFAGDYPKRTTKLKTNSDEVGEFRSNGGQSIIWGTHPDTKQPYQYVVRAKVLEIEFHSIAWPKEITNKPTLKNCTEETEEQKTRGTDDLRSSVPSVLLYISSINTVEDVLRISMPNRKRQNNQLLFKLARGIKTLEAKGHQFDLAGIEAIFNQWYARASQFLREGKTREDYYLEFMNACLRAKFPFGGGKIATAWEKAKGGPLPEEAMRFSNPEMRLLIAFLKQMQAIQGEEPFFLTYRDCAALLGHKTHTTAAMWLGALVKLNYIRVAEPGNEKRATRYFYVWKPKEE